MFQFNSGFSNWKVAGYLFSHIKAMTTFHVYGIFKIKTQKIRISSLHQLEFLCTEWGVLRIYRAQT